MKVVPGLLLLSVLCGILAVTTVAQTTPDYIPVVLWHGMGDTCCYPWSMGHIKKLIEDTLPGIYVYSVMVGNNIIEDEIEGFIGSVTAQLEQISGKFNADANLSRGFSAVGFSQGGQFLRGYVEMYNSPKVFNLVTMGGQHQGVFGLPDCPPNVTACEVARKLIDLGAYLSFVQDISVQAQYWHDPIQEHIYARDSKFIAVINNEHHKNNTYKQNLLSLENFAMVQFLNDTVVTPRESEWFGFYAPGQDQTVIPMEQTTLYTEDWIGLKALDQSGRLLQIPCEGNHLQFTNEFFVQSIITPFLNQTFSSY